VSKKNFELASKFNLTLISQLKDNHETLHKQVIFGCQRQSPLKTYTESVKKEHGRIEQRTYALYCAFPMLDKWKKEWKIKRIIQVTRYRHKLGEDPTIEESYYVSNGKLTVRKFAKYIRKHWFIENKVNYVKDMTFREDGTTKRIRPHNFSTLIDFAMNLLRKRSEKNIRSARYSCAWNIGKALDCCGIKIEG
jgi:predicted transposase YbfD/YdcC